MFEAIYAHVELTRCQACRASCEARAGGVFGVDAGQSVSAEDLTRTCSTTCRCGRELVVDAVILIRHGERWVCVLGEQTSRDQDEADLQRLLRRASEVLGPSDDLHVRVVHCDRLLAPAILSASLEIRVVVDGVLRLLAATSQADVADLMETHPELSSQAAAQAIDLIVALDPQAEHSATRLLNEWRRKIATTLAVDVTGAIGGLTLVKAEQCLGSWIESGRLEDLDAAFALNAIARQQLSRLAACDLHDGCEQQLLQCLSWRWARSGKAADEEDLVAAEQALLSRIAGRAELEAAVRAIVGIGYCNRLERSGDLVWAQPAITRLRRALADPSADARTRAGFACNLASALGLKWAYGGGARALSEAIDLLDGALGNLALESDRQPILLASLSDLLAKRHVASGVVADLDRAIDLAGEALAKLDADEPDSAGYMAALATRLFERAQLLGREEDLTGAAVLAERSIRLTPEDHPGRAGRLYIASNTLSEMHRRYGDSRMLEMAIGLATEALASTRLGDPSRRAILRGLSSHYLDLHHATRARADIDKAVEIAECAVAETPAEDPARGAALAMLSMTLTLRFDVHADPTDLKGALAAGRHSLAYPLVSMRNAQLGNMAVLFHSAFIRTGEPGHLEDAIDACRVALEQNPPSGAGRADLLALMAQLHEHRFRIDGAPDVMAAALKFARRAMVEWRLVVADEREISDVGRKLAETSRFLMRLLAEEGQLRELVELVEDARMLRLRAAGARQARSSEASGLISLAALASEVRAAEQDFMALAQQPGDATSASALGVAALRLAEARTARDKAVGGDLDLATPLGLDYRAIAAEARRRGEIMAYLVALDPGHGSVWILVRPHAGDGPDEADFIRLPEIDRARLIELIVGDEEAPGWLTINHRHRHEAASDEEWMSAIVDMLSAIGRLVMAPLAERLGADETPVTLIPAGIFGFAPLHAAPIDPDGTPFSAYFEVRYAASVSALVDVSANLAKAASEPPTQHPRAALIDPVGDLAFACAHGCELMDLYEGDIDCAFGEQATWSWLREAAARADLLDLSSHARFDDDKAASSAIMLSSTGTTHELTLSQVLRGEIRIRPGALVIANCCETGQFDPRAQSVEDQLGFPTGFLLVGAASVVATFWSVSDLSSWIAGVVLHENLKAGLRPAVALWRAANTLRTMTNADLLSHLDRAVASCRRALGATPIGNPRNASVRRALAALLAERRETSRRAPNGQPFTHPYYWAAYGIHGHG